MNEQVFLKCVGLDTVIIPESVDTIGEGAFEDCTGLTHIYIPSSVKLIRYYAFRNCKSLAEIVVAEDNAVYDSRNGCNAIIEKKNDRLIIGKKGSIIPDSVKQIKNHAFELCIGMTDIFIPASVNKIEKDAFSGCSDLEFISVSRDNKAYDSRDNCNAIIETASNKLIIGCKGTVIPNSVTSIGDHAFAHCYKLEKMLVPDSVKDMGGRCIPIL